MDTLLHMNFGAHDEHVATDTSIIGYSTSLVLRLHAMVIISEGPIRGLRIHCSTIRLSDMAIATDRHIYW